MIEFEAWPKLPRLNKPVVVTEKIDGTNACIIINPIVGPGPLADRAENLAVLDRHGAFALVDHEGQTYAIGAQSRNRLITPGAQDNAGFAGWVADHAADLVDRLGPGRHFGEWWGKGIQRGYDMEAKRFSLFNVHRYSGMHLDLDDGTALSVVPVLGYCTGFNGVMQFVEDLRDEGSVASPGFDRPEGIVAFHSAAGAMFKAFLEGDDLSHKGAQS